MEEPSFDLLDLLVCPLCKGGLIYSKERATLTCLSCGLVFPIREGIPVMLVEEASVRGNG